MKRWTSLTAVIEKYKSDHPNEKLTPEIVEKIRTDIFFE